MVINTFLVSGVIAIKDNHNVLMIWRQNYGYSTEIVSSVALMLLAPLVVLSYGAISFTGIILFFLPLVFIRDASLRYIQLQKAQKTLIASEVMAAKGEMAASIGHELNNYLAAISGRAQMILMLVPPDAEPKLRKSAEIIWETMTDMSKLTIGLMEVGNTAMEKRPSLLNELVLKTVEFVRV